MSDSKEQHTKIKGDGNTVNNELHFHKSNSEVKMPYEEHKRMIELERKDAVEEYKRNVELERKDAVEEYKKANSDSEKEEPLRKITEFDKRLADLPQAFEELQKRNAELVALLEQMGSKATEKKFQKAIDAFNKNEFAKADKILIEIEETETLNKKNFGEIAYARGNVAAQDVRWKDAAKHFARAAQIVPCYRNLILAERFAADIGDYDSALSFGKDAKKAALKEHGEDSKQYANSINGLALVYMAQKKYELAEPLHKESLKIRENIFGKKHPDVAVGLNNLGGIYQVKKQHREATHFFKRALNINKKALGVKHSSTAITLNNLGGAYRDMGEFKKAKPLLKQSLKIRKEALGDNHPETANSYNNLGSLYFMQGQYKKAEPFIRQALEIFEATLGLEHPNTKNIKNNYELLKEYIANPSKPPPK